MYDFRRKRVIKFLRADSHSVDEVADYVVRELGYTEVSPSDETYQTEYSNMRASFLLQYRPELLGDLTEPQRPTTVGRKKRDGVYEADRIQKPEQVFTLKNQQ